MTVEEAVALTIQAGALGEPGEVLILDMGEPVRILDVAERLANQADGPIDIVFTGLRDGEKLHETLFNDDENRPSPQSPADQPGARPTARLRSSTGGVLDRRPPSPHRRVARRGRQPRPRRRVTIDVDVTER